MGATDARAVTAQLADNLQLAGVVDFTNANRIRAEGERRIEHAGQPLTFRLGGLEGANSVTVAVMMAWYRFAYLRGKSISFIEVPEELQNIIAFSGISDLLLKQK